MSPRGIALFAAIGVIWGIPYLLIKVAVGELEPAMIVFARCAIAALVLLPIVLARRQLWSVLRRWRVLLVYTVIELVFPWFFLSVAEQRLPSSTSGLLIAAVPLVAVGVTFLLGRRTPLAWWNWLGILVGMLGVAAIVGLDVAGTDLVGVAQLSIVVLGYAIGPAILAKWMGDLPGVGVTAASLTIAAIIYLPIVSLTGGWPTAIPSAPVIGSVLGLALVCSALGFIVFIALIHEVGPVGATATTYINPAVAVLAGVLVLGEVVTIWTAIGFVLVLAGAYFVTKPRKAPLAIEVEPAEGVAAVPPPVPD
ncbi:MAG TPA: EamA family transporter [Microbacteriaceae bacterium]|nr:EamA family transporter [Microbacteriaceae bacterium]